MEGISHEACSLAGTLKLGKLIVFYDDNGISIDGKVEGWFADDTPKRFEAYGWHVQSIDGLDGEAIARGHPRRPGRNRAPVADLLQDHHRLGRADQGRAPRPRTARRWEPRRSPARDRISAGRRRRSRCRAELRAAWNHEQAGRAAEARWQELFARYRNAYPELAAEFERRMRGELPADWPETAQAALAAAQAVTGQPGDAPVLAGGAQC